MDYKYKRLGKNTVLVFIGNAGSKLIGLLLLPFYTKYLSPEEFGITDMIAVYASILLPIITACVTDGIFIFPKEANEEGRKKYFTSGLTFTIFTFVICSIIFYEIDIIAGYSNHHSTFTDYIWWILVMTISNFLQGYVQQFCRSIDKMVVYSTTGVVQTILLAGLAFVLVPHYGVVGYFWSLIIASILSTIYSFIFSYAYKYINMHSFDKKTLMVLLSYGLPLIPNSLMWWLVNGINRPLMESRLGLYAIGLYSVAQRFPSMINLLYAIWGTAWGISVIEEYRKPDFSIFYDKMIRLMTVVIVLGGIALTSMSKVLVYIFAATNYYDAWRYIPILTLAVIFQCVSSSVGGVFQAVKASKYFFYSSIWGALASLIFTYLFIVFWGLMGASIALCASFFCMLASRLIYSRQYVVVQAKPLLFIFTIFIIQIIIVVLDYSIVVTIISTIIALVLVVWQNLDLFKSIKNQIKSK